MFHAKVSTKYANIHENLKGTNFFFKIDTMHSSSSSYYYYYYYSGPNYDLVDDCTYEYCY